MPQLTPQQIQMAKQQGVSDAQIQSFVQTGRANSSFQTPQPTTTEEQKAPLVNRVGGGLDKFFGGGALGKAVGTSLYGLGQLAKGNVEEYRSAAEANRREFTPKVAAGDLIKMGTTLISPLIPQVKGATVASRIGQASAIGAGFGTANAVAESMKEDEQFDEIVRDGVSGAATGAVIGGVFQGGVEAMSALSRKLMTAVLNTTKTIEKKTLAGKVPTKADVADVLADKKIAGTGESILRQIDDQLGSLNDDINAALAKTDAAKQKIATKDVLGGAVGKTLDDLDNNVSRAQIEKILNDPKLPLKKLLEQEELSYQELNRIRQIIDKQFLGSNAWVSQNPQPQKVLVLKNLTNVIRNLVKESAPETRQMFYDSRMLNVGRAMVIDRLASKPSLVRYLAESGLVAGGVAGAVAGGGIAFPAAMITLIAGGRAASSPLMATQTGRALGVISNAATRLPQSFTINQLINAIYENDREEQTAGGQEAQSQQSPTQ